jgi:methyl-accepting chemotaxis protein
VVLVRKDAEKNSKCILNKAIDDVNAALKWPRGAYNGAILRLTDALEKCVKDGDLDDKLYKKAYDALAMSDKLDEMNKEFNKFYDKLKGFNGNDGESVDNCM